MFSRPRNYKRDIEHAALLEKANQLAREGTKGEKNKEEKKKKKEKARYTRNTRRGSDRFWPFIFTKYERLRIIHG